jgi:glycosyltransferase involved in cell wall biosynthesis
MSGEIKGLVSILVPIYKRLEYLPAVLQSVAAQDYPHIDLMVSDNGGIAEKAKPIIDANYPRPYRLRQTPRPLPIWGHYNDALADARGEFFVWLGDDDLISPNYVSELAATLQRSDIAVAFARQEVIDQQGRVLRHSSPDVPALISGEEFVLSWSKYGYECYATMMTRTKDVREAGGFGEFPHGTASDDSLLIRLCFKGSVAFSQQCTFQWRWHETSAGFAMSPQQLSTDLKAYLKFLDTHPVVLDFSRKHPAQWARMKDNIIYVAWETYFWRWKTLYRRRLSTVQWLRAAFGMPFIPDYYRSVRSELWKTLKRQNIGD